MSAASDAGRALVLGASGHVGNAVVRALLERGWRVTAASRRRRPATNLRGLDVDVVRGDADEPGRLETWVAGHDLVVDAAAPYPLRTLLPGSAGRGRKTGDALGRTRRLLAAVGGHGARLAHVSSFTTRPEARGHGGAARWLRRLHPYFELKEQMEALVLEAARGGLPAVVVNPTMCLGPWDLKPRPLCFIPQLLAGELPAAVAHTVDVVDVRDVAAGLVAAVEAERFGEPLLVSGHSLGFDELCAWACELGGVPAPRWRPSPALGLAGAWWAEALNPGAGEPAQAPLLAMLLLFQHRRRRPSPDQRALGAEPRPLSRTLADAIAWYRRLGYC